MKTAVLSIRLEQKEIENIEKMATAIGLSKRDFIRALISTSCPVLATETSEKSNQRFGRIQAEIERLRVAISELIAVLFDQQRTATFYEYRARRLGEGTTIAPTEYTSANALRWLLGLAVEYFSRYGVWPTPADGPHRFGQLPAPASQHWPSRQIKAADIESIMSRVPA